MKVTVLKPSGYCSGVDRAIKLAYETKKKHPHEKVVVLGMLVHNDDTLKALKKRGILTVYKENATLDELVDLIKKPSIVILTAHGHSKNVEILLNKKGHKIVDATCPFVNNSLIEIANAINKNTDVFYIGVKNHPESNAALSISKKIKLIDVKNPIIPKKGYKSPLIITQTTLSKMEVSKIITHIKKNYPKAKILDGICNASTLRQEALNNIPADADAIYVVGNKKSNNTKTLFNLANKLYPNKIVKLVENSKDIKEKDPKGLNHIVISSGASTPIEIIEQIKTKLLN